MREGDLHEQCSVSLTQGSLTPRQRTMAKGFPTLPHFVPPSSQKQTPFLLPSGEMYFCGITNPDMLQGSKAPPTYCYCEKFNPVLAKPRTGTIVAPDG